MIVENRGGKGNPYHDEEGKFTTGNVLGSVSKNYQRNYKEDLEQNPELGSKVFNLLGVSDIEGFLASLENMKQQSPQTYEKVCDFLDNFIEDNGGKIEFKDLESMTDEEIEKEIKHRANFFKNHNMFTDVLDTENTGLYVFYKPGVGSGVGKAFTVYGIYALANGKLKNLDSKFFKNKKNFIGFSRGIELCYRKFGNLFDKNNRMVFSVNSNAESSTVASCCYLSDNKKANISIECCSPQKYQNLYTDELGGYTGKNGKEMNFTNISNCSAIIESGAHEMGHALEHNIIDKLFPNNQTLKKDRFERAECMKLVATNIGVMTIASYMEENGTTAVDSTYEIIGSVSQYASTSSIEWFAECIGGIVSKKEENYLPAEKHLLKVLQDKDFIDTLRKTEGLDKYLPQTKTDEK